MQFSRLAGLVGGLLVSLPAFAAMAAPPAGWVKVETYGFTTYLPKDFREFSNKKSDPDKAPNQGSWGFMSPHATKKVWFRVSALQKGSLEDAVKRSVGHMLKNVTDPVKLSESPIPLTAEKHDGMIVFYKGGVDAFSHSKQALGHYEHMIIRGLLRMPDMGIQVAVTLMVRGGQHEKADEFFLALLQNTLARPAKEALALKKAGK